MKAIQYTRYGAPDVLDLVDVPEPVLGPNQVLIDVRAAGIGPGDCKTRAGLLQQHHLPALPKIPGRNGAGEVKRIGADVDYARVGDRVCFFAHHSDSGTCAELVVRSCDQIAAIPSQLGFVETAALVQPALCAWIVLCETAHLARGMRVLIHAGAGAVGGQAVQLARHLGAHVTATARSDNVGYVRSLGADDVIAYDIENFEDCEQPFDVIFDAVGGDTHRRSHSVLSPGGMIVCLNADPIDDLNDRSGVRVEFARIADSRSNLETVLALAAQGVLKPQVASVLPLADCAEAHRMIEARKHGRGRVVLQVS
jgi:NADPH:quinone reductase-like Zn-dependent oxidoreductase